MELRHTGSGERPSATARDEESLHVNFFPSGEPGSDDGSKKKLAEDQAVRLIGLVDYDLSGALIAESFRHQLEVIGLEVSEMMTLIEPEHYATDELKLYRYRLPMSQKTKTDAWMEKTGGVQGKRYGLESESIPLERLKPLVKEAIFKVES